MPVWKLVVLALFAGLTLAGCGRDDPQAALEAAADSLRQSIQEKDTGALLARIHPNFSGNRQWDRDWARRTAALMFLRHRNVDVITLSSRSWIDPSYADRGYSEGQVALTGAESLLPQRLGHYQVRLEWLHEDGEWLLTRLDWD